VFSQWFEKRPTFLAENERGFKRMLPSTHYFWPYRAWLSLMILRKNHFDRDCGRESFCFNALQLFLYHLAVFGLCKSSQNFTSELFWQHFLSSQSRSQIQCQSGAKRPKIQRFVEETTNWTELHICRICPSKEPILCVILADKAPFKTPFFVSPQFNLNSCFFSIVFLIKTKMFLLWTLDFLMR